MATATIQDAPATMILTREALETLAKTTSKEQRTASLHAVHLARDHAEATDGHRLVRICLAGEGDREMEPCSVQPEHVLAAAKAAPAKTAVCLSPGLSTARTESGALLPMEAVEVDWPHTEPLIPERDDARAVTLNARYLRDMADAAVKLSRGHRYPAIRIQIPANGRAEVRFDSGCADTGETLVGIIAAMRS